VWPDRVPQRSQAAPPSACSWPRGPLLPPGSVPIIRGRRRHRHGLVRAHTWPTRGGHRQASNVPLRGHGGLPPEPVPWERSRSADGVRWHSGRLRPLVLYAGGGLHAGGEEPRKRCSPVPIPAARWRPGMFLARARWPGALASRGATRRPPPGGAGHAPHRPARGQL